MAKAAPLTHVSRSYDTMRRKEVIEALNHIWTEVAGDVYPHVRSNREAVEVLCDRAYDRLSPALRSYMVAIGPQKLARYMKLK